MPLPTTFEELQRGGGVMLHLAAHADRARYSLRKLDEVGFRDIELVEGVDGSRTDPRAIAAAEGLRMAPHLPPGKVATGVSAIRLWRRLVARNLPYLLIFEDDVLPHPLVTDLGPAYWRATPRDVDWVFMGNRMDLPADEHRLVVATPCYCTHAYVVTSFGARSALSTLERRLQKPDGTVNGNDIQLREWMELGTIRFACWNGTRLPRVFPTSDQVGDNPSEWPPDIAWAMRDTGVFYQNYALGSTIWGPEAIWDDVIGDAGRQSRPVRSSRPDVGG